MSSRIPWISMLITLAMPAAAALAGQTVCPCTADTSVASVGKETQQNSGTSEKIKIKGRENQPLLKFDLSAIPKDAVITAASLRVKVTDPKFRLNQVAVSSVSTDWTEGAGRSVDGEGEAGEGACFAWPASGKSAWAAPGSAICDVTWGNGGSVENYGFAKREDGDWYVIPVDPRVVAAIRADSYGLIVQDESGWWAPKLSNIFLYSKEKKGAAPTLTVDWADADKAAPGPVKDIRVSTDNLDDGQVVLEFTCSGDDGAQGTALGYEIRCLTGAKITAENWAAAKPAPRWQTPRPKVAGQKIRAWITDLKAGQSYSFALVAYDQSANRSALAATDVVKLPKTTPPRLAFVKPIELQSGSPSEFGKMSLWATDELTKVDPVSGQVLDGDGYKDTKARSGSHIWDGQNHAIRLAAIKGEIVAFNLVIEATDGSLADIKVKPGDLIGPSDAKIPAAKLTPHRVWYVQGRDSKNAGYYGDPTPTLDKPLQIPAPDNKIDGQKNQSIYVDLIVPHNIPAGTYRGQLAVESSAGSGSVGVQLQVMDLEMPDELSYIIELNSYGWANAKDYDGWLAMHRLAHLHRTGYNVLSYGHCESVTLPFMPTLEGEGADAKVADWTEFDKWMAPLLDGSAFADLPRGATPIPHWYLPFHENYPGKIRQHYAKPEFFENEPTNENSVLDYEAWKDKLAATDVDIRTAFDKTWQAEASAIASQYRDHFLDKGWTKTQFQIFCNNKHYFREPKTQNVNENGTWKNATSLWTLDEPSFGRDFRALSYIYSVFKKPLVGAPLNVLTRGDVSRPEWQGDRCDNSLDLAVVSSALYRYQALLQRRQITQGDKLWFYGGGNGPEGDNTALVAMYIKTWTFGTDGGLAYWTSFAGADSWDKADQLAVVHIKGAHGFTGPVATTRLKAQRRAQQDIELMNLLARQPGWNRTRVAHAVASAINLQSRTVARGADDPGRTSFGNIHAADLAKVRYALVQEILAARKGEANK